MKRTQLLTTGKICVTVKRCVAFVFVIGVCGDACRHLSERGESYATAIENISDSIRIDGAISAKLANGAAQDGALTLQCDGSATLAHLDLSLIACAMISAGGHGTISGTLTGTDGNPATPTTVDNLRAAPGTRIIYMPALNPALNGETVKLAKLDGSPGGGVLTPLGEPGTLLLLR